MAAVSLVWPTNRYLVVSALGQQRVLGSYKTARAWLHKLRRAMVRPGRDCLSDVKIAVKALNRMLELGRPISVRVA